MSDSDQIYQPCGGDGITLQALTTCPVCKISVTIRSFVSAVVVRKLYNKRVIEMFLTAPVKFAFK